MNKNAKIAIVFMGGMISGFIAAGIATLNFVSKSDHVRTGIANEISDKISKWLCGNKKERYIEFKSEDILFETRSKAEEVFEQMEDILSKYGYVSLADLYDLAELNCPYTYDKFGWISLNNAEIKINRKGKYYINLPKLIPTYK